jgi:hypothetical protein
MDAVSMVLHFQLSATNCVHDTTSQTASHLRQSRFWTIAANVQILRLANNSMVLAISPCGVRRQDPATGFDDA